MPKTSAVALPPLRRRRSRGRVLPSPDLDAAPVLDRMCSQFVLTLTLRHVSRFNLRRDWASLLGLVGRHLVWPAQRARRGCAASSPCAARATRTGAATRRCPTTPSCSATAPGAGRTRRRTLFFYIDEYVKDAPKDLLAVLGATSDWLARSLKKESTLVEKNIDALAGLLQLNPAERALLLYGTLARYQRDLRGLLVEFKVANAAGGLCGDRRGGRRRRRATSPRRCAPARGSSASA